MWRRMERRADAALNRVIRHFELPRSAPLAALVKFVERWQENAIVETGSPAEFLDYLDLFVEARGADRTCSRSKEDAVQLLTAHAAKGLEFRHVAVIARLFYVVSMRYKEPLVEFPAELRRSGIVGA